MNSNIVGPGIALAGSFLLAIEMLVIRKATVTGRSFDAALASIWINVLVFVPSFFLIHGVDFGFTKISILAFVLSSAFGTVLGRICFYSSTKKIGASLTAPISQGNLLIATIFSILVIGEVITEGHLFGILILLAGIIVVSYEIEGNNKKSEFAPKVELLLPLSAMVFFGLSSPLFRIGLLEGTPLLAGFAVKSVSALAAVTGYSLARGFSPFRPFGAVERRMYLYAGVAQTAGFFLVFSALSISRVVVVAPFQNMQPFFVLILSYVFLGELEEITKLLTLGSIMVVVGAIVIGIFM